MSKSLAEDTDLGYVDTVRNKDDVLDVFNKNAVVIQAALDKIRRLLDEIETRMIAGGI